MTDLERTYQQLPTEKLLEILQHRKEYRRDAIDVAENELSLRNLSEEAVEEANQALVQQEPAYAERANEPATLGEKIGIFCLSWAGVGILSWLTSWYLLQQQGYREKWRQLAVWMAVGYGFFFVTGGILRWVFQFI